MRKFYISLLLVLPVFLFGAVGVSPQSEPALFRFIIPEIVAVQINNATITWDFSSGLPAVIPAYYPPTTPAATPHQTIDYLVWGLGLGGNTDWELTVEGSGDPAPACGILLGDIEYAVDPPVAWTPFAVAPGNVIASGSSSTNGWQQINHDYQVYIDGDETYAPAPGSSCTITYTIQTL